MSRSDGLVRVSEQEMHTMKTYSLVVAAFVVTSLTACGNLPSPGEPSDLPRFDPSGNGVLHGRVIAADNNSALEGVAVTATNDGSSQSTLTDVNGEFSFEGLQEGEWTVSIDYPGYLSESRAVRAGEQESVVFAIDSMPEPEPAPAPEPASDPLAARAPAVKTR